jgi:hypothetical protein
VGQTTNRTTTTRKMMPITSKNRRLHGLTRRSARVASNRECPATLAARAERCALPARDNFMMHHSYPA